MNNHYFQHMSRLGSTSVWHALSEGDITICQNCEILVCPNNTIMLYIIHYISCCGLMQNAMRQTMWKYLYSLKSYNQKTRKGNHNCLLVGQSQHINNCKITSAFSSQCFLSNIFLLCLVYDL